MLNFTKLIKKAPQKTPIETMQDEYARLCQQRDSVNARVAPLQAKLDEVHKHLQRWSTEAAKIAEEIQSTRGGESWLHLKKQIGVLAKALSGTR